MVKLTTLAAVAITGLATPAFSDPSIGFGLNFSFSGNGVVTSLGVRGFTDNEEDKVAGSLGLTTFLVRTACGQRLVSFT